MVDGDPLKPLRAARYIVVGAFPAFEALRLLNRIAPSKAEDIDALRLLDAHRGKWRPFLRDLQQRGQPGYDGFVEWCDVTLATYYGLTDFPPAQGATVFAVVEVAGRSNAH